MSGRLSVNYVIRWCFLLLGFCLSSIVLSEPLKLATSSWPPFIGRDIQNQGVAVEIVTTAFERAGIQTKVVMLPTWSETREGMEVGVYDVILGTWYSEERARFHLFSEPFMVNQLNFVRRKGSGIRYQSLSDIEGLIVATVNDYAYGEEFESYPGIYQVKSNHPIQALMTLINGDADLALEDPWVVRHQLKSFMPSKQSEVEVIPKPLSEKGLRIAVSIYNKKGRSIIDSFNSEVSKMRADGSLDAIVAAHVKAYE